METGKKDFSERAKLRYGVALLSFQTAVTQIALGFKAGFRPDQPRVPAGNPDGGQWTDENGSGSDGASSAADLVMPVGGRGRRPGGKVRIGSRWLPVTPAQQARLALSSSRMRAALDDVQRLDPTWRPLAQSYATVEGQIQANEAIAREAIARQHFLRTIGIGEGPFAVERVPARDSRRNFTVAERRQVNRIGRMFGCHTCGTTNPGPSGNFVPDHQPPTALNWSAVRQSLLPHCLNCSLRQGGWTRRIKKGN